MRISRQEGARSTFVQHTHLGVARPLRRARLLLREVTADVNAVGVAGAGCLFYDVLQ